MITELNVDGYKFRIVGGDFIVHDPRPQNEDEHKTLFARLNAFDSPEDAARAALRWWRENPHGLDP